MKTKLNFINTYLFTLIFISNILFFSCKSGNSTTSEDSTNLSTDTSSIKMRGTTAKTDSIPSPADTITSFAKANFTHEDSSDYVPYKSKIFTMIMSVQDFYNSYDAVSDDVYKYLYFDFTRYDPFSLTGRDIPFSPSSTSNHYNLRRIPPPNEYTSSGSVGGQRFWVRPSILYKEDFEAFFSKLRLEQIVLINHPQAYEIIILPSVMTDNTDPIHSQYIGLTLKVKQIADIPGEQRNPNIQASQKTNPCPKCNY